MDHAWSFGGASLRRMQLLPGLLALLTASHYRMETVSLEEARSWHFISIKRPHVQNLHREAERAAEAAAAAAEGLWILPQYPSLMTESECKEPIGWMVVHSAWMSTFFFLQCSKVDGFGEREQHPLVLILPYLYQICSKIRILYTVA